MKLSHRIALVAAALLGCLALAGPASATHTIPTDPYNVDFRLEGVADATAASTFATTSLADLAGATVTMPSIGIRDFAGDYAYVCYTADVIKATATTGSLEVWINGAVVAKTLRTVDTAAKNTTIGGCWLLALSAGTSNVVKLQGKSGDTNTFTVNQAELTVFRVRVN